MGLDRLEGLWRLRHNTAFEDKIAALSGCWGGVYLDLDTSELFQVDGSDMIIWKGWVIVDSDDKLDS